MGTKKVGAFPSPPRKANIIIILLDIKSSIFFNYIFFYINSLEKKFFLVR